MAFLVWKFAAASVAVEWFGECGCTGLEVEAVTALEPFASGRVDLEGVELSLNPCKDSCPGFEEVHAKLSGKADDHENEDEFSLTIHVVHIAYLGVCGEPEFLRTAKAHQHKHVYTVGRVMWETDTVPSKWNRRCNHFDEIWVPSQHNKEVFGKMVPEEAIHVIPEAVSIDFYSEEKRSSLEPSSFVRGLCDDNRFKFLTVFKWEPRKNWRALIYSFFREFEFDPDVVLYIKTSKYLESKPRKSIEFVRKELKVDKEWADKAVVLTLDRLSEADMHTAYTCADAFVLSSFGEAWGRPYAEAMASGLPTIAPAWGGQTHFMNDGNSLLVRGKLIHHPRRFGQWYKVDQKKLRYAMRQVVTDPGFANWLGERGKNDTTQLHPDDVARGILARVKEIAASQRTRLSEAPRRKAKVIHSLRHEHDEL